MTPAELVLERWGGCAAELTSDLGYTRTAWHQWHRRGGNIPTKAQRIILDVARKKGIKISPEELIGD